ncbi:hypothetical protein FRC04_004145 [Tulasnella sp. 424]|nr:hypothetical protein FRC04_004145 [Tulasnella sp. 424]KAG8968887.1 hypothetical protein FRC05_001255 [Tulasnella sp. 425]
MSVPSTPVTPVAPSYVFLSDGKQCQAHYTHYYDDGNIVFLVGDHVFRLFRSVLSRRSEVMKALFALPQPVSGVEPTLDGLPVIRLQDSMVDFAAFLDFIHPPSCPPGWATVPRWRALFGAFRIARKYGVDDIEIQALKGLEGVLPTTLETFERSTVYATLNAAVEVVNLSRELELEQFLPLAFYRLATLSAQNISSSQTMAVLCRLSRDDLVRLHVGRAAIQDALINQAYHMPDMNPHSWRCPGNRQCPRGGPTTVPLANKKNWTTLLQFPLEDLRLRVRNPSSYGDFCDECNGDLRKRVKLLQATLYTNLPLYFKLTD